MKKLSYLLAVLILLAVVSSCRSRNPHCPGVSTQVAPVEKVNHV